MLEEAEIILYSNQEPYKLQEELNQKIKKKIIELVCPNPQTPCKKCKINTCPLKPYSKNLDTVKITYHKTIKGKLLTYLIHYPQEIQPIIIAALTHIQPNIKTIRNTATNETLYQEGKGYIPRHQSKYKENFKKIKLMNILAEAKEIPSIIKTVVEYIKRITSQEVSIEKVKIRKHPERKDKCLITITLRLPRPIELNEEILKKLKTIKVGAQYTKGYTFITLS